MNPTAPSLTDALTLARDLIRRPSVTPRDEGALDVLQAALTGLGFTCERMKFEGDGGDPTDNLYAAPVMAADIQARYGDQPLMVVSPDVGGVVRARALAKRLDNAPLAIVDKRRDKPGQSEVMNIIGDVKGRACILIDDIIDSGGTLCNAAQALMDAGAASVTAYITHGVLTGAAVARVNGSALKELVITDTILATEATQQSDRIRILTIAPLIGEAIRRIADESSVSSLFD